MCVKVSLFSQIYTFCEEKNRFETKGSLKILGESCLNISEKW